MTTFEISLFAWGRVIERLLVVGFSGASMVLGWHLFVRGVVLDQTAGGGYKGWKVTFTKAGPGVFFAFFGAVVLLIALFRPLSIAAARDSYADNKYPTISYFTRDAKSKRRQVRVLNTFLAVEPKRVDFKDGLVLDRDYTRAQTELVKMRYQLLLSEFSASDLEAWLKYGAVYSNDPTKVPPDLRDVLGRMKPWFDDTMVMEQEE